MFLGAKKRILSDALLYSSIISFGAGVLTALVRFILGRVPSLASDMLNDMVWNVQSVISVVQIILTFIVFIFYWKRLKHFIETVPAEDRRQMGILQEEFFGKDIPALTAEDVNKLLEIWGVILVGSEIVYQVTSSLYREFIEQLSVFSLTGPEGYGIYLNIYTKTHGFKYLGMMIAIILGIIITGIFLNDRYLKVSGAVLSVLFLLVFAVINRFTFTIFGRNVGIVWTSVLFHAVDMAGLILLAVYLRRRYRGV